MDGSTSNGGPTISRQRAHGSRDHAGRSTRGLRPTHRTHCRPSPPNHFTWLRPLPPPSPGARAAATGTTAGCRREKKTVPYGPFQLSMKHRQSRPAPSSGDFGAAAGPACHSSCCSLTSGLAGSLPAALLALIDPSALAATARRVRRRQRPKATAHLSSASAPRRRPRPRNTRRAARCAACRHRWLVDAGGSLSARVPLLPMLNI
jgi:hypothetical protein